MDAENDLCSAQKEFAESGFKWATIRRKFSREGAQAVIESAKLLLKATKEMLSKEERE